MRKFVISGLAVFGMLVLFAFALPLFISSDAVRASLLERAREVTGREMQYNGDPRVSFSPFLGIEIRDVVFTSKGSGNSETPILSMPFLRANLSFASALRGHVIIDEFQFIQPEFNLNILSNGQTNWAFSDGDVWKSLLEAQALREATETGKEPDLDKLTNLNLGRFTVQSGTIRYQNEISGRKETITNFNGTLLWPNIKAGWSFKGDGIWRGDNVSINLTAATPVMLLGGGSSKLTAQIKSETINIDFDGEANRFSDLFIRGNVATASPSLRKMIGFFGGQPGQGSYLSDFQAKGLLSGTLKDLQLESAAITLDDNKYTGGLRLTILENSSNKLSGTLASQLIKIDTYIAGLRSEKGLDSAFEILNQAEVDIRFSAASMEMGSVRLTDFAGGIMVKDKAFKIDIGNANLDDGIVVGKVEANQVSDGVTINTTIDASAVNLAAVDALKKFSGVLPIGKSDIKLQLTTAGTEFVDLDEQLNGKLSIKMKSGELSGLDFRDIRSTLNSNTKPAENIQVGNSLQQAKVTGFELNTQVIRGEGWVHDSRFNTDNVNVNLSGKADIRTGNLAVWGMIQKLDNPATTENSLFFLGGTMTRPLYVPHFKLPAPIKIGPQEPVPMNKTPSTTN